MKNKKRISGVSTDERNEMLIAIKEEQMEKNFTESDYEGLFKSKEEFAEFLACHLYRIKFEPKLKKISFPGSSVKVSV